MPTVSRELIRLWLCRPPVGFLDNRRQDGLWQCLRSGAPEFVEMKANHLAMPEQGTLSDYGAAKQQVEKPIYVSNGHIFRRSFKMSHDHSRRGSCCSEHET